MSLAANTGQEKTKLWPELLISESAGSGAGLSKAPYSQYKLYIFFYQLSTRIEFLRIGIELKRVGKPNKKTSTMF
jgi:hypothetical protein